MSASGRDVDNWRGCEYRGAGGTGNSLHLLLIFATNLKQLFKKKNRPFLKNRETPLGGELGLHGAGDVLQFSWFSLPRTFLIMPLQRSI